MAELHFQLWQIQNASAEDRRLAPVKFQHDPASSERSDQPESVQAEISANQQQEYHCKYDTRRVNEYPANTSKPMVRSRIDLSSPELRVMPQGTLNGIGVDVRQENAKPFCRKHLWHRDMPRLQATVWCYKYRYCAEPHTSKGFVHRYPLHWHRLRLPAELLLR